MATKLTNPNNKPKAGTSLHKFIAAGGLPKNYKAINNVEAKTKTSKAKSK